MDNEIKENKDCEHCWHYGDSVLLTNPPKLLYCCYCNEEKTQQHFYEDYKQHGEYLKCK